MICVAENTYAQLNRFPLWVQVTFVNLKCLGWEYMLYLLVFLMYEYVLYVHCHFCEIRLWRTWLGQKTPHLKAINWFKSWRSLQVSRKNRQMYFIKEKVSRENFKILLKKIFLRKTLARTTLAKKTNKEKIYKENFPPQSIH